jgi:glycosyltransferase involved in cell wall biosynthesis
MTKAAPPITVAIPSIGRMQFLPSLIASLEAQTMGDFEALLLDNASPPEAQELFADQVRKDARFRVLRVEPRVPMFTNFNRGYLEGRGKYLVFFHDDDVYRPELLARHFEFFERNPRVAFSGSNYDYIDQNGVVRETRRQIRATEVMPGRRYIEVVMKRGRNVIPMQSIAYRREALAPKGMDDSLPCYFGDYVILMRMAEKGDVGMLAEPLVQVRRHEGQFSEMKEFKLNEAFALRNKVMRDYCAEFRERWPSDTAFAQTMEGGLRRMVRIGSVWGWLTAPNGDDAKACLDELTGTRLDGEIHAMLRRIDRLGLDAHARRTYLAPILRRVGNALGI